MRASDIQSTVALTVAKASAAADTPFVAANPSRLALGIMNDSTSVLHVLLAATGASLTNKWRVIPAATYVELWDYTGPVCGFWTAANGFAYVTELL